MKYTLANNEPFQVDGAINETPKSVNVLDLKTSDLTNDSGFITEYIETDPVFQGSAAHLITSNDISKWNSHVSWPLLVDKRTATGAAITADAPFSSLEDGQRITLAIKQNMSNSSTLNLTLSGGETTGAKSMISNHVSASASTTWSTIKAPAYIDLVYESANNRWVLIGQRDTNSTYTNVALGQGYATDTRSSATTAVTASLGNYALTTGGIVSVKFSYDVPANATLNINSKGAKSIYYRDAAITADVIKAGDTATFIYSTNYKLISIDRCETQSPLIIECTGQINPSQIQSTNTLTITNGVTPDDVISAFNSGREIHINYAGAIIAKLTSFDYDSTDGVTRLMGTGTVSSTRMQGAFTGADEVHFQLDAISGNSDPSEDGIVIDATAIEDVEVTIDSTNEVANLILAPELIGGGPFVSRFRYDDEDSDPSSYTVAYLSDLDSKMDIINLEEYCPTLLQELYPTMITGTPVALSQTALNEYNSLRDIEGKFCIAPTVAGKTIYKLDAFDKGPGTIRDTDPIYANITYFNSFSFDPWSDDAVNNAESTAAEYNSIVITHTCNYQNSNYVSSNNDYQLRTVHRHLQNQLYSGTNIKTVNNASLLGSGDVSIPSLYWCTCPTAQATNGVKVISGVGIPISNGKPVPGTTIGVMFETDNTNTTYVNNNVSFNIDSTGAIPICYAGITINPPQEMVLGKAGRVIYYTYKPGTEANNPGVWMWTGHDMDKDTKYNFSTLKVSVAYSNGEYTLSNGRTWSDISSAISEGRNVVLDYIGDIYHLSFYDGSGAYFACTDGASISMFSVDISNAVSYSTYSLETLTVPVTYSNGEYALGNEFIWLDIWSAISAGRNVVLDYNGDIYHLSYYESAGALFAWTNGVSIGVFDVDESNEIGYNTYPVRTSFFGTCSTAAATAAKTLSITGWQLKNGNIVSIKFTSNVPASATLNITGRGAKAIYHNGAAIKADVINAGDIATFVYDGTYYQLISLDDTRTSFYGTCSTAAATAAKTSSINNWRLKAGNIVSIKFTYNVPASATLNISGTNAKAIYHNGSAIKAGVIKAGDIATFVYDGTYYQLITVSVVTRPRVFFGFGVASAGAIGVNDVDGWELMDGNVINVYFQGNVPASAKLNVNGTGSFNIMLGASQALPAGAINATDTATFLYSDGAYYLLSVDGWYNRKQNTLVSGTNIKTVNSTSLLGSGNVAVQPTLVSGTNIKTINSTSLLGSGDIDLQSNLTYSISTSTTIASMNPNTVYCVRSGSGTTWDAITTLSITALNTTGYGAQTNTSGATIPTSSSKVPIYCVCFLAGASMNITLPSSVKWKDGLMPSIEQGEFCELVIMNNIATINKATF